MSILNEIIEEVDSNKIYVLSDSSFDTLKKLINESSDKTLKDKINTKINIFWYDIERL
jgi:hypothetical protein